MALVLSRVLDPDPNPDLPGLGCNVAGPGFDSDFGSGAPSFEVVKKNYTSTKFHRTSRKVSININIEV
jgi:hypothetical protein